MTSLLVAALLIGGNPLEHTVAAFVGKWKLTTRITPPGGETITVSETLDCKKGALGHAVTCVDRSSMRGKDPLEYAWLIGYDADDQAAHLYAVGSQGVVHDHRCVWKDERNLVCDPLQAKRGGSMTTEEVSFTWSDAKTMTMTVKMTRPEGVVQVTATGKR